MCTKKIKTPLSKKELKKRERAKIQKREKIEKIMLNAMTIIALLCFLYFLLRGGYVGDPLSWYPGRPSWAR